MVTTFCAVWEIITYTVCVAWIWVSHIVCVAWTWIVVTITNIWCVIVCFFRRLFNSNEVSASISECIYGWTSAYRITIQKDCTLQVTLRIKLDPDDDITAAELQTVRATWEPAIENAWSGILPISLIDGDCDCEQYSLSVDVQFVDDNEHHTVRVRRGPGRANMTRWFHDSSGGTAAHEAGHMFGAVDEYPDPACPGRTLSTDGSIMRNSQTGTVKERHYQSFVDWITRESCCDYEAG